ncbi:MAG TPA: helicase, partial [Gammaproteobacteria bacterium]|nr:helicase [Gammaproteobacteria bacterium]
MDLKIGDYVRLKNTHAVSGQISNLIQVEQTGYVATLRMSTSSRRFPSHQLELVPSEKESVADSIRFGHLPGPIELIRQISHYRLSGNLADVFYSMESSDTDFYAHQFKPVVKILESPTGKLLIADEVGLGKTIEAGLIWTELAARYKYNRLMVVCPKVLCDKWQKELATKFSIDAKIVNADELYSILSSPFSHQNGFAVICGMQSIRPRDKVKRQSRGVDKLADFLETADGM